MNDNRKEEELKEKLKKEGEKLVQEFLQKFEGLETVHVPIKLAMEKYRRDTKNGISTDNFIRKYGMLLKVSKIRNRWKCCKNTLEIMDFKYYDKIYQIKNCPSQYVSKHGLRYRTKKIIDIIINYITDMQREL